RTTCPTEQEIAEMKRSERYLDVTAMEDHEARSASMAARYYLKLGDIKSEQAGEGGEGPYAGWIRVASFRWSEKLVEDNTHDSTHKGKIAPDRITIVSPVNRASPELMLRVAIGAIIKGPVQLDCVVWTPPGKPSFSQVILPTSGLLGKAAGGPSAALF